MKKLLLAALATVGLVLGVASQASAGWQTRTVYRYDPSCGHSVSYQERYWVPDHQGHHHHDAYRRDSFDRRYDDRSYYQRGGPSFDFRAYLPFCR